MEGTLLAMRERVRGLRDMKKKPPNYMLYRSSNRAQGTLRKPLPALKALPAQGGGVQLESPDPTSQSAAQPLPSEATPQSNNNSKPAEVSPSHAGGGGGSGRKWRATMGETSRALPKLRAMKMNTRLGGRPSFQQNQGDSGDGGDGPRFPFNEEEYAKLWTVFNQLDDDGGGDLSMKEVSRIPELVGRKDLVIDRATFKRIDKDRSGTVDFIEMLRCLYPQWPSASIKAAIARCTSAIADTNKQTDRAQSATDWQALYNNAENVKELSSIFALYAEDVAPGTQGITKASLRKHLSSMSEDGIDELFDQYAVPKDKDAPVPQARRASAMSLHPTAQPAPQGGAALSNHNSAVPKHIPLDVFARIMEEIYTKSMDKRKEPLLYFQRTDGPIYPVALPRL
eukprot:TRINITY_DN12341_c0_g1_i1.p1 TRINITY_DN12341_c0_g1~~TRINITY_DN12341_c0_g1_i1.p1  ORF type:complete len:397 (+),score=141.46 TRINITY_DN12341_c0_g1_i1:96-1286(+)